MIKRSLGKFLRIPTLLCLALTLASVMPGTAAASDRSETAARAQAGLARVDSLLEAGQAAMAVKEARRLSEQLATDPLYGWQVEGRLGLALLRAGNPAEALPYLEAVMRRNPRDHVAHRNFAAALMATGRKGRALTEFSLAVEIAPGDYGARMDYGRILAEFRDVEESRTQFEVARTLCPDCPEADISLAGLLLEAGQYDAAVDPLRRIMDRKPTAWARRGLAQALAGAGRDRELLDFLDSRALSGLSVEEMNLAVTAEGHLGEASRSLACLRALTDPSALPGGLDDGLLTDHGFWGRVSLILLESGNCIEGLEAADMAISLAGENVVYRNNRVVLLLKLGRQEEAAREWEEVLRLDPSLEKKETE
ncbi:MAG: tetratricopeptide repeat protein [Candidatus Krumholzibacteria bacterium]|nr:tetratricopeptide repeat protein [Candidatus Krumholzibacteria bacterium]